MRPSTSFYLLAFFVNRRQKLKNGVSMKLKNGVFEKRNFAILAEQTTGFTYSRYLRSTYTRTKA
jgi:hypothetical protein